MSSLISPERQSLIQLFLQWNSKINLSAIRDEHGVYVKHILDSLEVRKLDILKNSTTLLDIGTGGWFPLLPIAMTYPEIQCTGIDARRKKIDVVNQMIAALHIPNAQAVRWRAEELEGSFDYITSRATAYADVLFEWSYHLLAKGWYFIFYKRYTEQEHHSILAACQKYHLALEMVHQYTLFEGDIPRCIYLLHKL